MFDNDIINNQKIWDTIAKSFDKTRRFPWKQCIDFINSLNKNFNVVDVSCGNGRHLIPCSIRCKDVIGIDISREFLKIIKKKIANKNISNINLIHSNVTNLPIKENVIDAVLYIAALHNIRGRDNRIKSLLEIRRIMKNDGLAMISVWSRYQDRFREEFLKKWFKSINNSEYGDIDIYWRKNGHNIPRFYHLYSKREFVDDLKKGEFEIIEIQGVKIHSSKYPDNYFAIIRK